MNDAACPGALLQTAWFLADGQHRMYPCSCDWSCSGKALQYLFTSCVLSNALTCRSQMQRRASTGSSGMSGRATSACTARNAPCERPPLYATSSISVNAASAVTLTFTGAAHAASAHLECNLHILFYSCYCSDMLTQLAGTLLQCRKLQSGD